MKTDYKVGSRWEAKLIKHIPFEQLQFNELNHKFVAVSIAQIDRCNHV